MATLICDTTPGGDGNVHAVIFHVRGVSPADVADWDDVDIGTTLTLVDRTSGNTSTGTLTAFETSTDGYTANRNGYDNATRVELTIQPS